MLSELLVIAEMACSGSGYIFSLQTVHNSPTNDVELAWPLLNPHMI